MSKRVYRHDSEDDVLAATLYAEARDQGIEGLTVVAWVIKNRVNSSRFPNSYKSVCLQDRQFDPWNNKDYIKINQVDADWFDRCHQVASNVRNGRVPDPTDGSDHYNNPRQGYLDTHFNYNLKRTVRIGDHQFYRSNN